MEEIEYVSKKEVKEYKKEMIDALKITVSKLKENKKKGFSCGIVGSAKRNLVLRKGNSIYDVDIQLLIYNADISPNYREDILDELKKHLSNKWNFDQSTSVITARIPDKKSFDLALIRNSENGKDISILNKEEDVDVYIWNNTPNSSNFKNTLSKIKGLSWNDVRDEYKKLRSNQWDKPTSEKIPSFKLYVQAINNVANNT